MRGVIALALLAGGVYAAWWFSATEGSAQRGSSGATEESSRLVEVIAVERGDHAVRIRAMGTVEPAREAVIRPRVTGVIVDQNERFVPGAFLEAGAFMVQVERTDYEQTIRERRSDLTQAEADLRIELGDQAVAREELELLELDIPEINREMILRIPQVNRAEAAVEAARAALERAELDLERTRITAPFGGHIVERSASVGDTVSPGDALATFVGSERYWIEVSAPVSSLRWIDVPRKPGDAASAATVRYSRAWGPGASRTGRLTQLVGRLEEGSRLARLLVEVRDPLSRDVQNAGGSAPELILGAFVSVEIEGRTINDAVRLDRDLVREGDVVWVMGEDDRLDVRPVTIAFRGRDDAYVTAGLLGGERVVRTNLTTPVDGMLLRLAEDERSTPSVADRESEADGG